MSTLLFALSCVLCTSLAFYSPSLFLTLFAVYGAQCVVNQSVFGIVLLATVVVSGYTYTPLFVVVVQGVLYPTVVLQCSVSLSKAIEHMCFRDQ